MSIECICFVAEKEKLSWKLTATLAVYLTLHISDMFHFKQCYKLPNCQSIDCQGLWQNWHDFYVNLCIKIIECITIMKMHVKKKWAWACSLRQTNKNHWYAFKQFPIPHLIFGKWGLKGYPLHYFSRHIYLKRIIMAWDRRFYGAMKIYADNISKKNITIFIWNIPFLRAMEENIKLQNCLLFIRFWWYNTRSWIAYTAVRQHDAEKLCVIVTQ